MLYTTFIRLCDEAVKHGNAEEFIMTLGWQEWMDKASDTDEITKDLSLIFKLASLDFPGLRKRLNVSYVSYFVTYNRKLGFRFAQTNSLYFRFHPVYDFCPGKGGGRWIPRPY